MTAYLNPSQLQTLCSLATRQGGVSARTLARKLDLPPALFRSLMRALAESGVTKAGAENDRLRFRPAFGEVMGIDLGASHLYYALADFSGKILRESTQSIRPEDGPEPMVAQIKASIRSMCGKASPTGRTRGRRGADAPLRAIALGVPSPVDARRGIASFANNLPGWENVPLRRVLEQEFGVPAGLENDANMAAIGEHWRGVAQEAQTFVFIALGTGIGSGVFTDGRLLRGRTGAAGELYLMNIEWPRWRKNFPETGYFENYVSGMGIAAEGNKLLRRGLPTQFRNLAEERDARFVFTAARKGSPAARAILEKSFTMLGVGTANLVAVLDPDLIVFGGGIVQAAPKLLLSTVRKVVGRIQPHPPPLRASSLGGRAQTYGAIHSAIVAATEQVLESS